MNAFNMMRHKRTRITNHSDGCITLGKFSLRPRQTHNFCANMVTADEFKRYQSRIVVTDQAGRYIHIGSAVAQNKKISEPIKPVEVPKEPEAKIPETKEPEKVPEIKTPEKVVLETKEPEPVPVIPIKEPEIKEVEIATNTSDSDNGANNPPVVKVKRQYKRREKKEPETGEVKNESV